MNHSHLLTTFWPPFPQYDYHHDSHSHATVTSCTEPVTSIDIRSSIMAAGYIIHNIGDSRPPAFKAGMNHLHDFLSDTMHFGDIFAEDSSDVSDEEANDDGGQTSRLVTTKEVQILRYFESFSGEAKETMAVAFCNSDFMDDYAKWLIENGFSYSSNAKKDLMAGTINDCLSHVRVLMYGFHPSSFRSLFGVDHPSQQSDCTWYSTLRSKVASRCAARDIRLFGATQEGVKKRAIGPSLLKEMNMTNLSKNSAEGIVDMAHQTTVFNNAGNLLSVMLSLFVIVGFLSIQVLERLLFYFL